MSPNFRRALRLRAGSLSALGAGLLLTLSAPQEEGTAQAASTLDLAKVPCSTPATLSFTPVEAVLTMIGKTTTTQGGNTVKGTIDCYGNVRIEASALKLNAGTTAEGVTVQPVLTEAATGRIDPSAGLSERQMSVKFLLSKGRTIPSGCYVGPAVWRMSTSNPGGQKYDTATGQAKLADSSWTIPALVQGDNDYNGCGYTVAKEVNSQMKLPAEGAIQNTGKVSPIVVGAPCLTSWSESEPNNSSASPNVSGCAPPTLSGSTAPGDGDYFQFAVSASETATLEHVVTYSKQTIMVCGEEPTTRIRYSGPFLSLSGKTAYTKVTKNVQEGKCIEGGGGKVTTTYSETYALRVVLPGSSTGKVLVPILAGVPPAGFPSSGAYSLKLSVAAK